VSVKITAFWDITQWVSYKQTYVAKLLAAPNIGVLEAVRTSQTVINFYKTSWLSIPEISSSYMSQFNFYTEYDFPVARYIIIIIIIIVISNSSSSSSSSIVCKLNYVIEGMINFYSTFSRKFRRNKVILNTQRQNNYSGIVVCSLKKFKLQISPLVDDGFPHGEFGRKCSVLKERVSRASRLLRANPSLGCDGILVHACI
jgi:hypothetical protein